jgi:hypothetical protein
VAKILYENKFILTKAMHHEYCSLCFTKMRKNLKRMSLIFSVIFYAVTLLFMYLRWTIPAGITLVMAVYFTLFIFFGYRVSEWINYRNMQRDYGKYIVMQVFFEPVNVRVKTGDKTVAFKYTTITGSYETDDMIILILQTGGMVEHGQVLFKKGFAGDPEGKCIPDFKKMVNEKSHNGVFEIQ